MPSDLNKRIQVNFHYGLVRLSFQHEVDLLKRKNPCAFYKDRFITEMNAGKLLSEVFY